MGITELEVARRPRVAILATGDELVPPTKTPGPVASSQTRRDDSVACRFYGDEVAALTGVG